MRTQLGIITSDVEASLRELVGALVHDIGLLRAKPIHIQFTAGAGATYWIPVPFACTLLSANVSNDGNITAPAENIKIYGNDDTKVILELDIVGTAGTVISDSVDPGHMRPVVGDVYYEYNSFVKDDAIKIIVDGQGDACECHIVLLLQHVLIAR